MCTGSERGYGGVGIPRHGVRHLGVGGCLHVGIRVVTEMETR
jgi:hypothetical protein